METQSPIPVLVSQTFKHPLLGRLTLAITRSKRPVSQFRDFAGSRLPRTYRPALLNSLRVLTSPSRGLFPTPCLISSPLVAPGNLVYSRSRILFNWTVLSNVLEDSTLSNCFEKPFERQGSSCTRCAKLVGFTYCCPLSPLLITLATGSSFEAARY